MSHNRALYDCGCDAVVVTAPQCGKTAAPCRNADAAAGRTTCPARPGALGPWPARPLAQPSPAWPVRPVALCIALRARDTDAQPNCPIIII